MAGWCRRSVARRETRARAIPKIRLPEPAIAPRTRTRAPLQAPILACSAMQEFRGGDRLSLWFWGQNELGIEDRRAKPRKENAVFSDLIHRSFDCASKFRADDIDLPWTIRYFIDANPVPFLLRSNLAWNDTCVDQFDRVSDGTRPPARWMRSALPSPASLAWPSAMEDRDWRRKWIWFPFGSQRHGLLRTACNVAPREQKRPAYASGAFDSSKEKFVRILLKERGTPVSGTHRCDRRAHRLPR